MQNHVQNKILMRSLVEIIIFFVVISLAIRKWIKIKDPLLLCILIIGTPIFIMKKFDLPLEFSMLCMAFSGGISLFVYFFYRRKEKFLCAFAILFLTLGVLLILQTMVAMGYQDAVWNLVRQPTQ